MDATKEFNRVVNEMHDGSDKTSCEYLVERVLVFLKNFVKNSKLADVPLQDGSSCCQVVCSFIVIDAPLCEDTMSRLMFCFRNIDAITSNVEV